MRENADKPRVLVVHNRDFEHSQQDPENGSRADIRGTSEDVVAVLARAGFVVDALGIDEDLMRRDVGDRRVRARRRVQPVRVAVGRRPIRTAAADAARARRHRLHGIAAADARAGAAQAQGQGRAARARAFRRRRRSAWPTADVSAVTLPFPLIVKPSREDASVGISSQSVVHDRAELGGRWPR